MSTTTISPPPLPPGCVAAIGGNYVMKNDRGSFDLCAVGTGFWAFGLDESTAFKAAAANEVAGYEGRREYAGGTR